MEWDVYSQDKERIERWMFLTLLLYSVIECITAVSVKERMLYLAFHMDKFLLNYLMLLIITSPCLLFHRMLFVFNMFATGLLGLTYTSRILMALRGMPLRWADFFIMKEGMAIADKYMSLPIVLLIVALVCSVGLLLIKTYSFHLEVRRPSVMLCFFLVVGSMNLVAIAQVQRVEEEQEAMEVAQGLLTEEEAATIDYRKDGLVYGFIASYESAEDYVPSEYSKEKMEGIKEALALKSSPEEVTVKPNIIFLQVESFIDPYSLEGITYEQDPIPHMRAYMEGTEGGILKMPDMNTARTEFEILTGMRLENLFKFEVPYTSSKLDDRPLESIAQVLRRIGYHTTALHDNHADFYNRPNNYNKLGFDNFIALESMENVEYDGDWPKDKVLLPYIEETLKATVASDFIFAVTVGTHSSYKYSYEGNRVPLSGQWDEKTLNQVQDYVDRLHETDLFVGELIEKVEKSEEPTILVVYGDHIPSLDVISSDENYPQYEVPYFIVSNMALGERQAENPFPAYRLYSEVLRRAKLPSGIISGVTQDFSWDQEDLDRLDLVSYDLLFGEHYLADEQGLGVVTDLQLDTVK